MIPRTPFFLARLNRFALLNQSLSRICNRKSFDLSPSLTTILSTNVVRTISSSSSTSRRVQYGSIGGVVDDRSHRDNNPRSCLRLYNNTHHHLPSSSLSICIMNSSNTNTCRRTLSTNAETQEDEKTQSNRAAFKATPVIPSILNYIEKIGVGLRRKPRQKRRKSSTKGGGGKGGKHSSGDTLDEIEESHYFAENEKQHRVQWREKRNTGQGEKREGRGKQRLTKKSSSSHRDRGYDKGKEISSENRGAYWLPPPPFSSFTKVDHSHASSPDGSSLPGNRRIIRRPVKLLGKAGSLNDGNLPRESKGLSEVAIAGRSNVGKSTLLNALLYGNTDESLSPRKYQRGKTPDGNKLPKGVKAVTSAKPGQTKELSFYQLTADVIARRGRGTTGDETSLLEGDDSTTNTKTKADSTTVPKMKYETVEKMSLLLVDLPGYGFAFAKEERTQEWKELMHHYLLERRGLKRILLLLDARHGFKKTDFDFLGDLQDGLMAKLDDDDKARRELPPIQIILTKCDLVKQADLARRVVVVRQQLSDFLIREPSSLPVMLVSARAGLGFNNVRKETPLGGVLELQRELASLVPRC